MTKKPLLHVNLCFLNASHCFYISNFIWNICTWKKCDFQKLIELFGMCDRLRFDTLENRGPSINQGRIRPFIKTFRKIVLITLVLPCP